MRASRWKSFQLSIILLISQSSSGAPRQRQEFDVGACAEDPATWSSKFSELAHLSTPELEAQTIRRVEAHVPSSLRAQACIPVEIIVSSDGRVLCARSQKGHPLLRAAAERAAKRWAFTPFKSATKTHPVTGELLFSFNTSSDADACLDIRTLAKQKPEH